MKDISIMKYFIIDNKKNIETLKMLLIRIYLFFNNNVLMSCVVLSYCNKSRLAKMLLQCKTCHTTVADRKLQVAHRGSNMRPN